LNNSLTSTAEHIFDVEYHSYLVVGVMSMMTHLL